MDTFIISIVISSMTRKTIRDNFSKKENCLESLTSVIGRAGFGWSGDNCLLVGDTGAAETPVLKPSKIIFC